MKFLIKEISPSRKEIRVSLTPIEINGMSYYIFGGVTGNFDEGSINPLYTPSEVSNYYSVGPNPAIIRLIVAYLKDTLGTVYGFSDTVLFTKENESIPIINIAVDDISLVNLSQDTIPSIVVKLLNPLPTSEDILDEISIEKQIISTQEQEVYYISATEPPAVIRGLDYDEGMRAEISDASLRKIEYENYNDLTSSFKQGDNTQINDIISSSNTNFKIDYSEFENYVHFGSALSRIENFKTKVSQIEDHLVMISKSLQTTDNAVTTEYRRDKFDKIETIKSQFTDYEKTLYYKSDILNYNYNVNVGPNYIASEPLNTLRSEPLLHHDGFNSVYKASGSVSPKGNDIPLFRGKYMVEDKPFYNNSGSFYLSFLMKSEESVKNSNVNNIQWINNQKNHIPMIPKPTLYTSSLLEPNTTSSAWFRYIYQASSSYWAPNRTTPVIGAPGTITNFDNLSQITIFSGSGMSGSHAITCGGRYSNLATVVTASGIPFTGSIVPAGELFRINVNTNYGASETNITSSYLTDIKITKYDPSNSLPFSEVYRTGSTEFGNWYNEQYQSASLYDQENVHSLLKTLPAYISEDNQMNNKQMRNYVNMVGEHFDEIKNYVDSYITIFKTQYGEVGSVPDNLLPILASQNNWEFSLPFGKKTESDLVNYLGTTMSQLNNNANTKNNIWRNIVNNLQYIYKRKGTQESIRALLNSYGFPPDVMKIREAGASMDQSENAALSSNAAPSLSGLSGESGNTSFTTKVDKMVMYVLNGDPSRIINTEWRRDGVDADGIEFVMKPIKGNNDISQSIIHSSGSEGKTLWDVVLEPSQSSDVRGRLTFRINNYESGDSPMNTNIISMSTNYYDLKNQNYWNVLVQRTAGASGSDISITDTYTSHSYEMYIGENKNDKLRALEVVSMSYGGTLYASASENWIGTGSRTAGHSGNLVIGKNYTGSISEIRTWKYPLSASVFKQHVYDKKSAVGNSLTDSQTNLIYHYRLNENWISGSKNPKLKDANPKNVKDYSISFSGPLTASLTSSLLYDADNEYERIQFSVGVGGSYELSDNNIIIDNERRFIDNLNPFQPSMMSVYHPLINKRKASSTLELTKSPQEVINDFILNQLGNFDFNDKFADPRDIGKERYAELEKFADDFFQYYDIWIDINKYIRTTAAIFNEDLIKSLKRLVPARAAFSKVGVEVKPTFFERQKLNPPSIEKQILSFEAEIPFTDWEKDKYSLTTIDNLKPIFQPGTHMEINSHTGSSYYDFTDQYELYQTKNAHIELASVTGSKKYYDFTDQYELNPHIYELSQTKDTSFNIKDYGIKPYPSLKLTKGWSEYVYYDVHFDVASSTGSLAPTYTYEHYKYHNYHFDVASATGSISNEFTKYEPLYLNKDVHFDVASATGSITKNFTKYEPLYTSKDITLFSIDNVKHHPKRAWDESDKSNDRRKNGYYHLFVENGVHDIYSDEMNIASSTGSISKNFTTNEPLYKYNDYQISVASATGSVSKNFTRNEPYPYNKDLYIFDVHNYYNSSSKELKFINEILDKHQLNIFNIHDHWKNNPKQTVDSYNENGYINFKNSLLDNDYKNSHLFDVHNYYNSSSKNLRFVTTFHDTKDSHIELISHTGSKEGYYDYTNQYELIKTKDTHIDVASSTGSITTFDYELYQTNNLNLFDVHDRVNSNKDDWNIKLTNQTNDPKNLHLFDVHNYYDSSSESNNLRFTNKLHNPKNLHLLNVDNYYKSGSDTNKIRFRQEMYPDRNFQLIDMDNMYHSSSKYLRFNTENYNYYDAGVINVTNDFNSNTDSEIISYISEEYKFNDVGFNVASSTGSVAWDFNKSEPLYVIHNMNLDVNEKGSGGSESSSVDIISNEFEYRNGHIEYASATSSNPDIDTDIFLPHIGTFDLLGNTTFYEHAHKSFTDLADTWGTSSNDVQFIHYGYAGKDGNYNTYHYEKRYIFHSFGDVESVSGSNASISSSFETDYDGTYVSDSNYTASKHFSNEQFLKLNDFLGNRPVGTTIQFKPSAKIDFGGGKYLDETFVYPSNHIFNVGSSKDSIDRLIYKGTQNLGGDIIESEAFTDLDENAYYHVLTTGGDGPTVQN